MNKFIQNISNNSSILTDRAALVGNQASLEQENLVRGFESQINRLKMEIMQMCDLSPADSTSLKPVGQVVDNPSGWVKDLHNKKKALALLQIDLKIAQETTTEWFTELQVELQPSL